MPGSGWQRWRQGAADKAQAAATEFDKQCERHSEWIH